MDTMGTLTRRMMARSRISSWGGGGGGGTRETGTGRAQCSEGHIAHSPVTTQVSTPSPGSGLLAARPGSRGLQSDTPGYRHPKTSPTRHIYPGHSHQSWPRMYTTQR